MKVTSQWFNPPTSKSLTLFRRYLQECGFPSNESQDTVPETVDDTQVDANDRVARGRYKGNAMLKSRLTGHRRALFAAARAAT